MREIFIDVVNGSDSTIKVTQNDNLTGSYKLIITENGRRLDLTDKNIKFAFVKSDNHLGDIIEDLRITNAAQGEIDFPITNRITKVDGLYSCGIAIYNSTGYLEHTGTFNLYVRKNIFEKVSGELLENSAYKELMSLLDKATNLNSQLNPLVTNGTALKHDLENDINQADNLKNDLEANTNRANGANSELVKNTATAEEKNTTLNNSLEEAKKYINGLDGSQNIPQIRMDLDTLQNGLKSNQELAYEGTNLKCDNTLDGRIEDIVLEGMTYHNLFPSTHKGKIVLTNATFDNSSGIITFSPVKNNFCNSWEQNLPFYKPNTTYTIVIDILENTLVKTAERPDNHAIITVGQYERESVLGNNGFELKVLNGVKGKYIKKVQTMDDFSIMSQNFGIRLFLMDAFDSGVLKFKLMILEGDYTHHNSYIPAYFKGIKSVAEKESKISILTNGKNLCSHLEIGGTYGVEGDKFGFDYANNMYLRTNYIDVKNKKQLSRNVSGTKDVWANVWVFYDENKKGIYPYGHGTTINVPSNAKYCRLELRGEDNSDISPFINQVKCMIVEGNKTLTEQIYEPYKQDKKELKLPFEDGLKGLPNGAKDLIYNKEDGCYVSQKIGKQIFDENSPLQFNKDSNGSYLSMPSKTKQCECICNKLKSILDGSLDKNIYITAKTWVIINKECNSLEEYKIWLRNNPLIVYYELAEPIEYKISDTKLSLDTYNALTYVFSNNAISPNIKLKVASNLGSIIQQNAKSINDIYKLIDEVLIPQITTNTADIAILKLK